MIRLTFCFLLSLPLLASPFSKKTYKYLKKVDISVASSPQGSYSALSLPIDEEVFLHSSYGDIRIFAEDTPLPYVRRQIKIKSQGEEQVEVKQLYKKRKDEYYTFVLELPILPKDYVYTSLFMESEDFGEANLGISSGNSPDTLSYLTNAFVFSYSDKPQNKIDLGGIKHRFLKISSPNDTNLRFSYAIREKLEPNAYFSKKIDAPQPTIIENNSVYLIENLDHSPFSQIQFTFNESKFQRAFKIEHYKNNKEWESIYNSEVFHNQKLEPELNISLNQMVSQNYRITIVNGDNPPLTLKTVTQLQPKEELIAFVPENIVPELTIYYGNRFARMPDFDPSLLPTEETKVKYTFNIGSEVSNPDFGFTLIEPPISGYIANSIFYIGLILLLGIGFRFYKSMPAIQKV
jgi:hypothetical protein